MPRLAPPKQLAAQFAEWAAVNREAEAITGLPRGDVVEVRPDCGDITANDIVAQGRRGFRGMAALDAALRARLGATAATAAAVTAGRTPSRSRGHAPRASASRRTRSSSSSRGSPRRPPADDDDPDPDPPVEACQGCGREIVHRRRGAKYHSDACKKATYRRRTAEAEAEARQRVERAAWKLRKEGKRSAEDALLAVVLAFRLPVAELRVLAAAA